MRWARVNTLELASGLVVEVEFVAYRRAAPGIGRVFPLKCDLH